MKIAIIGAGFTGLAAAHELVKYGHQVVVLEKNPYPGGLAAGFQDDTWDWSLEHHYHHIFKTDADIQQLFQELDLASLITFKNTHTAILSHDQIYPFDNAQSILGFPHLSYIDKLRLGAVTVGLKVLPWWQFLESITAKEFLIQTMGQAVWKNIWKPLFEGKFKEKADTVNAAWFWARIHARTKSLGYIKGGFLNGAQSICNKLTTRGVTFHFEYPVKKISSNKEGKVKIYSNQDTYIVNQVLVTSPAPVLQAITPQLPSAYLQDLNKLIYTGAITLITESTSSFFSNNTYWLNVNQKSPVLAIVEHTNFVDKSYYGNKHLTYFGKYTQDPKLLSFTNNQLLKMYAPTINNINPEFQKSITRSWAFSASFAQPIPEIHHSQILPDTKTPIDQVWWASMQHIYPWDRGTNYAVRLGKKVAQKMHHAMG